MILLTLFLLGSTRFDPWAKLRSGPTSLKGRPEPLAGRDALFELQLQILNFSGPFISFIAGVVLSFYSYLTVILTAWSQNGIEGMRLKFQWH